MKLVVCATLVLLAYVVAIHKLECDEFANQYFKISSSVDAVQAAKTPEDLLHKSNVTRAETVILLKCEGSRGDAYQHWAVEVCSMTVTRACSSRDPSCKPFICSDFWSPGTSRAYFNVEVDTGRIYWDPEEAERFLEHAGCESIRNALLQLQSALQERPEKSEFKNITQESHVEDGKLVESKRFEKADNFLTDSASMLGLGDSGQVLDVPGLSMSSLSNISTISGLVCFSAPHPEAPSCLSSSSSQKMTLKKRGPNDVGVPVDSDQGSCPSSRATPANWRRMLGCDEWNYVAAMESVIKQGKMNEDAHILKNKVVQCIQLEERVEKVQKMVTILSKHLNSAAEVDAKAHAFHLLAHIKSISAIELLLDQLSSSNNEVVIAAMHTLTDTLSSTHFSDDVKGIVVQALNKMTSSNKAPISESAWLSLSRAASYCKMAAEALLSNLQGVQSVPSSLRASIVYNAANVLSVDEMLKIIGNRESVTPAVASRLARVSQHAPEASRKKLTQLLDTLHSDESRRSYEYEKTSGNRTDDFGNDYLGAGGYLYGYLGASFSDCRTFGYKADISAGANVKLFRTKFQLADIGLLEEAYDQSIQSDRLHVQFLNYVFFDGAIFSDLCSSVTKKLTSWHKQLPTLTASFPIGGFPTQISFQTSLAVEVRFILNYCAQKLSIVAAFDPITSVTVVGTAEVGFKFITAGLDVKGTTNFELIPGVNATAFACPRAAVCPFLDTKLSGSKIDIGGFVKVPFFDPYRVDIYQVSFSDFSRRLYPPSQSDCRV